MIERTTIFIDPYPLEHTQTKRTIVQTLHRYPFRLLSEPIPLVIMELYLTIGAGWDQRRRLPMPTRPIHITTNITNIIHRTTKIEPPSHLPPAQRVGARRRPRRPRPRRLRG